MEVNFLVYLGISMTREIKCTQLFSNQSLAIFYARDFCIVASTRLLMRASYFENGIRDFRDILCVQGTSRYKSSFFPDAIISWNNIITNVQNVRPFTSLKAHILFLIRP